MNSGRVELVPLYRTFRRLEGWWLNRAAALALEAACENQEAIQRRLEESLDRSSSDESRYRLSLSVGMARFDPKRPASLGKLISIADEAMYEHKKHRPKLTAT